MDNEPKQQIRLTVNFPSDIDPDAVATAFAKTMEEQIPVNGERGRVRWASKPTPTFMDDHGMLIFALVAFAAGMGVMRLVELVLQ